MTKQLGDANSRAKRAEDEPEKLKKELVDANVRAKKAEVELQKVKLELLAIIGDAQKTQTKWWSNTNSKQTSSCDDFARGGWIASQLE